MMKPLLCAAILFASLGTSRAVELAPATPLPGSRAAGVPATPEAEWPSASTSRADFTPNRAKPGAASAEGPGQASLLGRERGNLNPSQNTEDQGVTDPSLPVKPAQTLSVVYRWEHRSCPSAPPFVTTPRASRVDHDLRSRRPRHHGWAVGIIGRNANPRAAVVGSAVWCPRSRMP